MSESINRPFVHSFGIRFIHSFHYHLRLRDWVLHISGSTTNKKKCFLCVGERSFYPGRRITNNSKHQCEGNNNNLKTNYIYFFTYIQVLHNNLKTNYVYFLHISCTEHLVLFMQCLTLRFFTYIFDRTFSSVFAVPNVQILFRHELDNY